MPSHPCIVVWGLSKWRAVSDSECIPAYFKTSNFRAREYVLFTALCVPLPFDLGLLAPGPRLDGSFSKDSSTVVQSSKELWEVAATRQGL